MNPILFLAAAAAAPEPLAAPPDDPSRDLVVTASREPVEAQDSVMPVTSVETEMVRPGPHLPMAADALRALPGLSVATSGPSGSQTQVRIRGAEANHTLLFVDGIRFNDPAAGNEARFELLTTDGLARIDVVRGAQSALWGSEAIGGVIAAYTAEATAEPSLRALAEVGSHGSSRLSATASTTHRDVGLSATAIRLESEGFDSFDGTGDRDSFSNRSASLKAIFRPSLAFELGAVGHWIEGESEYDGLDPVTFRRADTQDMTRNRIGAVRGWAEAESGDWSGRLEASFLASVNRNLLAGSPLNRTAGNRLTVGGQLSRESGGHRLTVAAEHQSEEFSARDQLFFGATDQDRSRALDSGLVEWVAEWRPWLTTDVALRHDRFSAFRDATTARAGLTVKPRRNISLIGAYGEGIAQPSFYDLFGFFPGSFVGNPALRPERSEEWHAGIRRSGRLSLALGVFTARLRDEIVGVFDPATFRSTTANATGASRRRGIEAEAELRLGRSGRLSLYYTLLDAEERQVAGDLAVREIRRPRHSAAFAGFGRVGPVQLSARIAYVGKRRDTDFDSFPARAVILDDYLLASASLDWRISSTFEAYVRAENAFDELYQDVFGYRSAGRTVHAGLRLRLRD
ncbi:TonB-dependent receptor plug domain-containing protein [Allosphingosinicella sp.]|jgi:vitamin B12 transporter|uniref:TonB-dependent receptor plug domain-containing protein n=1 Tax=Allosphingosinicella sp. TaxID=2823234 RepID=UPI002EFF6815